MKKRILIIEDSEDICRLLSIRLESHGFEVLTALDGQEGLDMIESEKPHLIILDLFLPRISGEDVCKAVRENRDTAISSIPIIMLTSKRSEVDRIIGMVIGANAYIEKPFDPEQLLEQVGKCLQFF